MSNFTRNHLVNGNLVAGAAAEGYGSLVAWQGAGDMTRAKLATITATVEGFSAAWLPAVKSAIPQLAHAVRKLSSAGIYGAERVAKSTWDRVEEPREWASRWILVNRATSTTKLGEAVNTVAARVTLYVTADGAPELAIESSSSEIDAAIRSDFEARIGEERYVASDVTAWLGNVLRYRLNGVRLGGVYFVPRSSRVTGEGLCEALRRNAWGKSWLTPALPVATTAQLEAGLANGLVEECGEVAQDATNALAEAEAKGETAIGERRATTLLARVRFVGERIRAYAVILGSDGLRACFQAFCDAMIALPNVDPEAEWSALRIEESLAA
jgi:hypothetical protein